MAKRLRKPIASIEDNTSVLCDVVDILNRLQRIYGGPGIEVREVPGGHAISAIRRAAEERGIWGTITGHEENDGRFVYSWAEVEKTAAGYGGWTNKENGRNGEAFNSCEEGDMIRVPVPDGSIVALHCIKVDDEKEYWFSATILPGQIVTDIAMDESDSSLIEVSLISPDGEDEKRLHIEEDQKAWTPTSTSVVTNIPWDGTYLKQTRVTIAQDANGQITVSAGTDSIIDTPESCS